uniref:GIY-YIG domain-containing protein n=1 Tax=viral metagenome TaxID=1070528 RepID=A0A6C0IFC8_9ZZZZ
MSLWYCYLLESDKKSYVGATLDPDRRLRQHNGEISGGAKATKGSVWKRVCLVGTFPEERDALQFEWKWKNLSKSQKGSALERRKKALEILIMLEQSTKNARPFREYEPLTIQWVGTEEREN